MNKDKSDRISRLQQKAFPHDVKRLRRIFENKTISGKHSTNIIKHLNKDARERETQIQSSGWGLMKLLTQIEFLGISSGYLSDR